MHDTSFEGLIQRVVPKYSIIIVNYNGGTHVLKCLESVFRYTTDFELILVDNNSTDQSAPQAKSRYPQIMLIKNDRNLGFAKANNAGIRGSRGYWIVLLNPDTVVTNGWLDNLAIYGASSEIGIVGPKLVRLDGRTIDSAGLFFNPKTGLSYDRGAGMIDTGQFDSAEIVPCLSFACAAIKREVIDRIGPLDGKMVLYFDDIDYCIRSRLAGWNVMYCPKSVVFHARGGVTPSSFTRVQSWAVAYRLRIMLKCYNSRNAIKYGLSRVARDVMSMAAGIKNADLEYFLGYFRSPVWNLMNIPLAERRHVQATRRVPDDALFST